MVFLEIEEKIKNLQSVKKLYDYLVKSEAKRNLTVISIGGGVTQDITGFLASTLYRGVKWIYIPTTLLAQADSCIGAKTSLNFRKYKNLLGTFYPPHEILLHTGFLDTLNELDFFSGLGEVVKLQIIAGDAALRTFHDDIHSLSSRQSGEKISEYIVKSLQIKKEFIEEDEFDLGRRNILNFGHDLGHAMESSNNYRIPHGQAVLYGMVLADIIALNRGLLDEDTEMFLFSKVIVPFLKFNIEEMNLNPGKLVNGLKKDKKKVGSGLPIILLKNDFIFEKFNDLTKHEISESVKLLKKRIQLA